MAARGGGFERLEHQAGGAVLGPGGAVAGGVVGFDDQAVGLDLAEQPERALRLAHHAGGLGAAFHGEFGGRGGVLREAEAILPLLGGGDEGGGDVGLGRGGGAERGDAGDGGAVAAGEGFRAVGEHRGEGETEGADEVPGGVGGELGDEVGGAWGGGLGHGGGV